MPPPPRPVSLAFVDLENDTIPVQGKKYKLVPANSTVVKDLPFPSTEYVNLRMQALNLYVEDLPDRFTNRNEAILKLNAHTRTTATVQNKEELAFTINFDVRDKSYSPGFLQKVIFRNIILKEYFELKLDLTELDQDFSVTYDKISKVVSDSGLSNIDALNSIPYIKVATKLFDGLVHAFGKNADDKVWDETPSLYLNTSGGGAFLRSGIYVLYETESKFQKKSNKKKPGKPMPVNDLRYVDEKIINAKNGDYPISNHFVFNILLAEVKPESLQS